MRPGSIRLDDLQGIASAQREVGQAQERKLPGVRRAAVGSSLAADQPRPDLLHGVGVTEGRAGDAAPDKQVHHHGPAEQFPRTRVGPEGRQLAEDRDRLLDFGVRQRRHEVLGDIPAASIQRRCLARAAWRRLP